jgi:hypothetical protein
VEGVSPIRAPLILRVISLHKSMRVEQRRGIPRLGLTRRAVTLPALPSPPATMSSTQENANGPKTRL